MSILQEYKEIREAIGEEEYSLILEYLATHPDIFLSDIYYNKNANDKFQDWKKTH